MRSKPGLDMETRRGKRATRLSMKLSLGLVYLVAFVISSPVVHLVRAQQPVSVTIQQTPTTAPGTFVIRNARIVTVSGAEIENGTVVIRNGLIESVGAQATAPAGAEEINGQGL